MLFTPGLRWGIIMRARSGAILCKTGGTNTKYYWGNTMDGDYVWYWDNSGQKTHPVGKKKPNPLGLYDISGNVWEWVNDMSGGNYYSSPENDPKGPDSGNSRILRGGSWYNTTYEILSSVRVSLRHWSGRLKLSITSAFVAPRT